MKDKEPAKTHYSIILGLGPHYAFKAAPPPGTPGNEQHGVDQQLESHDHRAAGTVADRHKRDEADTVKT